MPHTSVCENQVAATFPSSESSCYPDGANAERIGAGVPTGLQSRMPADKTVSGGFDSHPLRLL